MLLERRLKLKTLFFATLTGGSLLLNYPGATQTPPTKNSESSRILNKAKNQNTLDWGLRVGSPPISYTDRNGVPRGFCPKLIDLLEKYLKENKIVNNTFKIEIHQISYSDRFIGTKSTNSSKVNLKNNLKLDGECGNDTIRRDILGIEFSNSFARTDVKILLNKAKKDQFDIALNNRKNDKRIKIGVLKNSTTTKKVKTYFEFSVEVIELNNRESAIQALTSGDIDAFASDEIILKGILEDPDFPEAKSYFIHSSAIGKERYGLVLPADDDEWVKTINKFLEDKDEEIRKLTKEYLEDEASINWSFDSKFIVGLILLLLLLSGLYIGGRRYYVEPRSSAQEQEPNSELKTNTFEHGYALLIGVGESADDRLSLPVTVKDVRALYDVLIDPNFCAYPNNQQHIRLLHDKEATRNKILEALNWLKEQAVADPEATVIVYYSGHGWLNKNQSRYYLLQHDIDPSDIEGSALSAENFTNALRQVQAKRLLVIIDSCHAAGMATAKKEQAISKYFPGFEESAAPKGFINNLKHCEGRVVFTSSAGKQFSWVRRDGKMSIYTYHFIEALKGAANNTDDTVVKVSHIMTYLSEQVPRSAYSEYKKEQSPHYSLDGENFPIALRQGGKRITR
jgi:ABC-type amino acid transport substrate-binding protein